jgi:folate-binding protein YgfZ
VPTDQIKSLQTLFETRNAATTSVAFFDVSDRTQIEVTGSDRARFLHSFTSNDIKRLKPGQGCETFLTNLKGKVVAHVFAFCRENSFWLDGTPGQTDAIMAHLRKFVLIDDVQFHPAGAERGELYVSGPLAAQLLQLEQGLQNGEHLQRETDIRSIDIRRVDLFGVPGFLMSIPADQIDGVKQGLAAVGVAEGSPELFEALRIEAGYPKYGLDITDDNLAQEAARTKQCISFNKGCYLGQETIARLDSLGHTNRELRRLRFETPTAPATGTVIFDPTGTTELGVVTSASAELGKSPTGASTVIAIGMLKQAACPPDTEVCVNHEQSKVCGLVLGH